MIKLITHTDLDGVSNAIVAFLAFGKENVDVSYCNYDKVDKIALEVLNNHNDFTKIFITDISVSDEVAKQLNSIEDKLLLLDHHTTALFLNKYDWCQVIEEMFGEKTCGTSLFYNKLEMYYELINNEFYKNEEGLFNYTEMVRKYDTWLWNTKYNDNEPRDLNTLLYLYGRDKFIDHILYQLNEEGEFDFTNTDKVLLKLDDERKQKYIKFKNKSLLIKEIQGYKAGVVFGEQYHSELGNELAKLHPELDFIVIVSDKTISYRGIKDSVNLGEIAKIYGGGGHPKAAGSQIAEDIKQEYLKILFDK
jgi:oligoribonuclease NrnB/cAMP/cGMP phosphodiesterase (DHH superfamily)